jgi:hypothetical protein
MSEERELALLTEIRTMLAMDKTTLAETYQISIDSADDYRNTKATAIIDCIIDNLNDLIQRKNEQDHYKGFAAQN